jgi:DNA polymerase-3 subunit epsilon/ATP-dependent DNA helicase DinG
LDDTCPFYKARRAAEAAHILIVNHALLLADVAVGSRVLPDYKYLILDEAHHLEEATTNGLSFRLDQIALRRQLAELGGRRTGILGDLLNSARNAIPDSHLTSLPNTSRALRKSPRRWSITSTCCSTRCSNS